MIAPYEESYRSGEERTLVIFDVSIPEGAFRLHRERAAYGEHADIEALDENHFVLIAGPGGAERLAA